MREQCAVASQFDACLESKQQFLYPKGNCKTLRLHEECLIEQVFATVSTRDNA